MESAICLRYCPFPYGSKGLQAARPSRFHLKFNHATPFYVPQFSTTTHPVTRSIKHATCMLERFSVPSENERKSGNKILRGVTAVSLVLACVLGLFNFRGKMNPKFNTAYASQRSYDLFKVDADGRSALGSLLEIMSKPESSIDRNQTPSNKVPDENYVNNLKLLAIRKSESKEGNPLSILRTYYEGRDSMNNEEAKDYIEVALVEVYMFQESYEEARNELDKQIDEIFKWLPPKKSFFILKRDAKKLLERYHFEKGSRKLGIAKRILYKAIVHTMLNDEKANVEAKKWWQAFISLPPVTPEK